MIKCYTLSILIRVNGNCWECITSWNCRQCVHWSCNLYVLKNLLCISWLHFQKATLYHMPNDPTVKTSHFLKVSLLLLAYLGILSKRDVKVCNWVYLGYRSYVKPLWTTFKIQLAFSNRSVFSTDLSWLQWKELFSSGWSMPWGLGHTPCPSVDMVELTASIRWASLTRLDFWKNSHRNWTIDFIIQKSVGWGGYGIRRRYKRPITSWTVTLRKSIVGKSSKLLAVYYTLCCVQLNQWKEQVDLRNLQTLYYNVQHDLYKPITFMADGRSSN